jgi:hypothetical protein
LAGISELVVSARLLAAVALVVLPLPGAQHRVGGAAHYGPGTFERVAIKRGLAVTSCLAAVTDNHRIGARVTITRLKTGHAESCVIADVCNVALGHCRQLRRRGIVAELSFGAAKRLCGIRYAGQEPPRACRVRVAW